MNCHNSLLYRQLNRCVQKGECNNGDLISNIVEEDGKCSSESETCCKEEDINQVRFFYKVDLLDSDLSPESDEAKNHCCVTVEKLSNFTELLLISIKNINFLHPGSF